MQPSAKRFADYASAFANPEQGHVDHFEVKAESAARRGPILSRRPAIATATQPQMQHLWSDTRFKQLVAAR
jgi:hypothetical protein